MVRLGQSCTVQPASEVGLNEVVVIEMGVGLINAVDFLGLAGRELFVRIEAERIAQEPLAAQDLVDARNAARETVRGIEKGGVAISHFRGPRE